MEVEKEETNNKNSTIKEESFDFAKFDEEIKTKFNFMEKITKILEETMSNKDFVQNEDTNFKKVPKHEQISLYLIAIQQYFQDAQNFVENLPGANLRFSIFWINIVKYLSFSLNFPFCFS